MRETGIDGGYLPYDYMDENVPPARPTPSAWIMRLTDGAYALTPADIYDGIPAPLDGGKIVQFCKLTRYGKAILTLSDDSYLVDRPMPLGADNVMVVGDTDTLSPDLSEPADRLRDGDYQIGDEYEITYYTWSDGEDWRFDQSTGSFKQVEARAA
jgi:hypothetical protein